MPEKLIIRIPKVERKGESPTLRITDEAMKRLEELHTATRLPLSQLASKMLIYAADNCEIIEE